MANKNTLLLLLLIASHLTHAGYHQVCQAITAGAVPLATSAGYHYYRSYLDPKSTRDTFKPFMLGVGLGTMPLIGLPVCAAKAIKKPHRPLEKPTVQGLAVGLSAYAVTTCYLLKRIR